MTTKPSKLLKAKPRDATSHNKSMADIIDKVQAETEVPMQVRLPESLATRVKVFCAQTNTTHKVLVSEALEAYLRAHA